MKEIDSPPTAAALMESTRSIGYSFESAISDIIDNSISASAKRIWITSIPSEDPYVTILDDGEGLKQEDLQMAMRYGAYQIISSSDVPSKYYYGSDDKNKCKSIRYSEHFVPNVTEKGVFYQYRRNKMRANRNGLCPALTASMGAGGHNVPIILDNCGIRRLMPLECLKVQGFPDWYNFPDDMADCHKYKQVGNSVTVPVIERFANLIYKAFENVDTNQ